MEQFYITRGMELTNGNEILQILESRGFEFLAGYASSFEEFFYFRRAEVLAKIFVEFPAGEGINSIAGVQIYREVYIFDSFKPNEIKLPMVLPSSTYISAFNVEEFTQNLDSNLDIEDRFILVDSFEKHAKSATASGTIKYLNDCFLETSKKNWFGRIFSLV